MKKEKKISRHPLSKTDILYLEVPGIGAQQTETNEMPRNKLNGFIRCKWPADSRYIVCKTRVQTSERNGGEKKSGCLPLNG